MQKRKKIDVDKLAYEKEMLALGAEYIAGADEVGRGPLAGPWCARRSSCRWARANSSSASTTAKS